MKTLRDILEAHEPFELSEYGKIVYNAQDSEDHPTGVNVKGEKVFHCIYSVYATNIKDGICFTEANNAWGGVNYEVHRLNELIPYSNK
jgi:hypothetical protein